MGFFWFAELVVGDLQTFWDLLVRHLVAAKHLRQSPVPHGRRGWCAHNGASRPCCVDAGCRCGCCDCCCCCCCCFCWVLLRCLCHRLFVCFAGCCSCLVLGCCARTDPVRYTCNKQGLLRVRSKQSFAPQKQKLKKCIAQFPDSTARCALPSCPRLPSSFHAFCSPHPPVVSLLLCLSKHGVHRSNSTKKLPVQEKWGNTARCK